MIKIGEREKDILKAIGLGMIVVGSLVMPNLPIILVPFLKKQGPRRFKETLHNLEEKGVIYLSGDKVKLTVEGKKLLEAIEIQDITIKKSPRWDSIWRLVSYDIPENFKHQRNWFRNSLKQWGFKQIQKSLWVLPWECEQEVAVITHYLRVSPYVIVMQTDHLPREKQLKEYFNL